MYQLRRSGPIGYEDLMREIAVIEHKLLKEDSALAMNLMVLEAKLRERFQYMETLIEDQAQPREMTEDGMMSLEEIQTLIPQDMPAFPALRDLKKNEKMKRLKQTIGMAALFAVLTAGAVFGLASALQIVLNWLV